MSPVVQRLLSWGSQQLSGFDSAELDASLLLAHVLGLNRLGLYTATSAVEPEQEYRYRNLIAQRARGLPIAYLVGYRDFWKHRFRCDPRALIPRPETELLVEQALAFGDKLSLSTPAPLRVLDLCTGTGCVGISLALERPAWQITLADISPEALALAKDNADLLGARTDLILSDLFQNLSGSWNIITANPPYLSRVETQTCLAQGWGEPSIALDGGNQGTEITVRLMTEAKDRLREGGILLWEAAPAQHTTFVEVCCRLGSRLLGPWRDLAGRDRVWGMQV